MPSPIRRLTTNQFIALLQTCEAATHAKDQCGAPAPHMAADAVAVQGTGDDRGDAQLSREHQRVG